MFKDPLTTSCNPGDPGSLKSCTDNPYTKKTPNPATFAFLSSSTSNENLYTNYLQYFDNPMLESVFLKYDLHIIIFCFGVLIMYSR